LEKYKINQNELKKKTLFSREMQEMKESERKKIVTAKKGEREKKVWI
jgi:hypothetical protein